MDQLSNQLVNMQPLILIVDDEEIIVKTLADMLQDEGYRVVGCSNPHNAMPLIGELVPDVVLMDVFMPGLGGIDLVQALKKEYPQQLVIMISGFGNIPIALEAVKAGAYDFIEKPFSINEVIEKIKKCLALRSVVKNKKKETVFEQAEIFGLVGKSPLFIELLQQAAIAGNLTLPVLLYGPIGVGKRTFIRFINYLRFTNGLIQSEEVTYIDCFNLPSQQKFIILINAATALFFNAINLLPYRYQELLLSRYFTAPCMISATAITSLYDCLQKGLFHFDLYELLHAMPLEIPPLSKRPYDIPLLVNYYLKKQVQANIHIEQSALRALRNYEWKKNITELELVLNQCVAYIMIHGGQITLEVVQHFITQVDSTLIEEQSYCQFPSFEQAVASFEKKFLLYHLKKNRYDLERVCSKIKLNILQLQNKLAALDIVLKISCFKQ